MMLLLVLFLTCVTSIIFHIFFFQAEDGIRDLVRSRGLGDVYKRQDQGQQVALVAAALHQGARGRLEHGLHHLGQEACLLSLIHI